MQQRQPRLSSQWAKHLKGTKEKEEFELSIKRSIALRRLKELIDEFSNELERNETDKEVYDSPSWAFKQAHINGQRSAYLKLNELLNGIT